METVGSETEAYAIADTMAVSFTISYMRINSNIIDLINSQTKLIFKIAFWILYIVFPLMVFKQNYLRKYQIFINILLYIKGASLSGFHSNGIVYIMSSHDMH